MLGSDVRAFIKVKFMHSIYIRTPSPTWFEPLRHARNALTRLRTFLKLCSLVVGS